MGPKRYTDLREGLPGLATDLLATRLRELQDAGVIDRREVPRPTPATVYELTERGLALKAAILELSHWGRPLLQESSGEHLPDSALLLGLKVAFRPQAAGDRRGGHHPRVEGRRGGHPGDAGQGRIRPGHGRRDAS